MVPMWMFANAIACGNTFILKPSEKDPSASIYIAELLTEAGVPDGVFNVVHGDKVAVDAILEHPDDRGGLVRRLDADRPLHLRDRHEATASASRRSAARRTTWSCCPTPTSTWRPMPRSRPPTARPGERCMAVSVVVAVGDVGRPARRGDQGAAARRSPSVRAAIDRPRWARSSRREHRDKVAVVPREGPASRAPTSSPTAATTRSTASRTASSSACRSIDNVTPEMDSYRNEIFGPVLEVVRVPDLRRGA